MCTRTNPPTPIGECYRTLGLVDKAKKQFSVALALNPAHLSSVFNLGLTHQDAHEWEEAVERYRQITAATRAIPGEEGGTNGTDQGNLDGEGVGRVVGRVSERVRLESKIRECDLLQALGRPGEALACWEDGTGLFPLSDVIHNELGNLYGQAGMYGPRCVCWVYCIVIRKCEYFISTPKDLQYFEPRHHIPSLTKCQLPYQASTNRP